MPALLPWTLYVDGAPLVSFLDLEDATAALWEFMQDGRKAVLVRSKPVRAEAV